MFHFVPLLPEMHLGLFCPNIELHEALIRFHTTPYAPIGFHTLPGTQRGIGTHRGDPKAQWRGENGWKAEIEDFTPLWIFFPT